MERGAMNLEYNEFVSSSTRIAESCMMGGVFELGSSYSTIILESALPTRLWERRMCIECEYEEAHTTTANTAMAKIHDRRRIDRSLSIGRWVTNCAAVGEKHEV